MEPLLDFCGSNETLHYSGTSTRVGTRYSADVGWSSYKYQLGIFVVAIGNLFGAIHFAAWSSPFPSDFERLLWRVCSLILLSMPEIFLLCYILLDRDDDKIHPFLNWVLTLFTTFVTGLSVICTPLYAIARLALIVEAFVALRALTPAALAELEWTSFIPHI